MEKIIRFPTWITKYNKITKDRCWYYLVPPEVTKDIYEMCRGAEPDDAAVYITFSEEKPTTLAMSCMGKHTTSLAATAAETVEDFVIAKYQSAKQQIAAQPGVHFATIPSDVGCSAIYAQGEQGIIGVGFYDHANSRKGQLMAALLLYTFGLLNARIDNLLGMATYCYLPYEMGIDRSMLADIEQILRDYIQSGRNGTHSS